MKTRRPFFLRWRWWVCWLTLITAAIALVYAFGLSDSLWRWAFWIGAAAGAEYTTNAWEDADERA